MRDLMEFLDTRWREEEDIAAEPVILLNLTGSAEDPPAFDGDPNGLGFARWVEYIEDYHPNCITIRDPQRLKEIKAKRTLIARTFAFAEKIDGIYGCGCDISTILNTPPRGCVGRSVVTPILFALVTPYDEHPDYREAWK